MTADSSEQDPAKSGDAGPDGLGRDGIAADPASGVRLGAGTELNTFEPEEEPEAVAQGTEDTGDSPAEPSAPGR
ncbi:hypothetical protein [Arthrobacter sp. fls2-241-R2A-200]|uniref:hypothetical protein n=1 Tax=unclassified Arthrobacter TaxID=235627 RepID=UPI00254ECA37|nr:hypothetical protein [Arthrobacter sp. fls2-241-R2A-200]